MKFPALLHPRLLKNCSSAEGALIGTNEHSKKKGKTKTTLKEKNSILERQRKERPTRTALFSSQLECCGYIHKPRDSERRWSLAGRSTYTLSSSADHHSCGLRFFFVPFSFSSPARITVRSASTNWVDVSAFRFPCPREPLIRHPEHVVPFEYCSLNLPGQRSALRRVQKLARYCAAPRDIVTKSKGTLGRSRILFSFFLFLDEGNVSR